MSTVDVRQAVSGWLAEFAPTGPVLVAVSGGADSLALAAAVIAEIRDRNPVAATVDHGLQSGSAQQAQRCSDQLHRMGYQRVEVLPVTVGDPSAGGGPEAAARTARYAALGELADRIGEGRPCPVLLGHTLDDQAETVLLGLSRGSGPRSIAGMRPWRRPWGRPLLAVRRSDTESYCAATGIAPWSDPHNVDPAFTRVRLRSEVLPLLEEVLGGGVAPALARTADLLADDLAALDELAARLLVVAGGGGDGDSAGITACGPAMSEGVDIAIMLTEPAAVRRRALRLWLATRGVTTLTAAHLTRLDELLTSRDGAAVRVPGGTDVTRSGGRLLLEPTAGR